MAEYAQTYPGKTISAVTETIAVESKNKVVVEVIAVQREEMRLPVQIVPEMKVSQPVREDADWSKLLDVVARETSYVAPGTQPSNICYFIVQHVHILLANNSNEAN